MRFVAGDVEMLSSCIDTLLDRDLGIGIDSPPYNKRVKMSNTMDKFDRWFDILI